MIHRSAQRQRLSELLERSPVVVILGARQVGKTTLARQFASSYPAPVHFFDLEDPADRARLSEPGLVLRELEGLVVLDEIQRLPEVFQLLRVLADRPNLPARFLVLGSASPDLLRQSSESLAGRVAFLGLDPLSLAEVGAANLRPLWLRGGFPRSFLAARDEESAAWRQDFIRTFLERDLPELGISIPSPTLRRFWTMVAHYHGQLWNGSELARAFSVAASTVRHYLDLLTATLVVRQLQPWHENLSKRQVKAPKVYLADTGLLHSLLGIDRWETLESHPKVGASFEGFALAQVVGQLGVQPEECFFWATHGGAELDLLVIRGGQRLGFEFKRTETPRITPSMRSALSDLRLDQLTIIHAGAHSFPLGERVRAVAVEATSSTPPFPSSSARL